jgi:hypothetical protein
VIDLVELLAKLESKRDAAEREQLAHRAGTRDSAYWHGVYVGLCDAIVAVKFAAMAKEAK